jgi:hypothetical protein
VSPTDNRLVAFAGLQIILFPILRRLAFVVAPP